MENLKEKMENDALMRQATRNYEEELRTLEKRLCYFEEENHRLKGENECLKDCIVKMSIARYVMNGT